MKRNARDVQTVIESFMRLVKKGKLVVTRGKVGKKFSRNCVVCRMRERERERERDWKIRSCVASVCVIRSNEKRV